MASELYNMVKAKIEWYISEQERWYIAETSSEADSAKKELEDMGYSIEYPYGSYGSSDLIIRFYK